MQDLQGVTRGQQNRVLGMSTLAFTVCFAVWTIFSIIGVRIKQDLGLSDTEFGLLAGTPILTGSLSRIFLGIWTDQYGGRIVYVITMTLAAIATFLLSYATTYEMMLLAALGVGLAGGSFAVGIAYVSRWYPKEKQGTALGIFGAGNVGAAVTKFCAPFVLVAFGWTTVAQVWAAVLLGCSRPQPEVGTPTWDYVRRLRDATGMKLLVKGIVTGEDAAIAIGEGVDGIFVSNHGGRAENSLRPTVQCIADVAAAVAGRAPVLVDGGFRRGTDIYKALALGATAVGVGRPYIWGLTAFGQEGVEAVLEILRRELLLIMRQSGVTSAAEINTRHIIDTAIPL